MAARGPTSVRAHVLAIVVFGAILPLALIGGWLTSRQVRSGRNLLGTQLDTSLANIVHTIGTKWESRRGLLILLAENEVAREAVARGAFLADDSAYFDRGAGELATMAPTLSYRDRSGREIFHWGWPAVAMRNGFGADSNRQVGHGTFHFTYPVTRGDSVVGSLESEVLVDAILPGDSARVLLPGSSFAVRDPARGNEMVRLAGTAPFPDATVITIGTASWLTRTIALKDPRLDIAVGAPLGPYTAPFVRAGRISLAAVILVALLAVALAVFFTTRLSLTINALVDTTGAVAGGDLSQRVETAGPAELRRLAVSFNTMSESLRHLIAELSERRALAAVGEFAAALSHEVRNALTAIQIDLERVDERTEDAKNRTLVDRSLVHVRRLDAAVTGSLRIARSGRVEPTDVVVADLLDDAARVAEPSFVAGGGRLVSPCADRSLVVRGDAEALHQLFLNLLLNAQQALAPGGETHVTASRVDGHVVVAIVDTGRGMTSEQVDRAFDPYYTTRPKGTGLGLPIARQIAAAHGGELRIESVPEHGTRVEVRLPVRGATADL